MPDVYRKLLGKKIRVAIFLEAITVRIDSHNFVGHNQYRPADRLSTTP